ncbi:MAG: MFS transporter [Minisyncoccota bacterium]
MSHIEEYDRHKVRFISLISFFMGFLDAFLTYILSTYFAQVTGSDNVGPFYLIAFGGVLISLLYLQPLLRSMGKIRALSVGFLLTIIASVLLMHLPISWFSVGIILLFLVITNVIWVILDILLESFSQDQRSGRIRGFYLTIMNGGLLLSPFLSTLTLDHFQYQGIFFVLILGYSIVFFMALVGLRDDNGVFQGKIRIRHTFQQMFLNKNLFHIYHVSFALEFFYAMMIVYTPLYLRSLYFTWHEIGLMFTVMLLPFVLLQYPLGVLADKRWGEKELLFGSIALTMFSTVALVLLDTRSWWVWAGALFVTRIGVAGIEVLRDAYFYKQVDGNHFDMIAFFRTTRPIANIIGALMSFILLLFFPLVNIFWLIGLVLSLALYSAWRLEDTKGVREEAN